MGDRDRFDKFTQRARKVLSLAQEEAQRFQHNYIGTEHILIGLVREDKGVAAHVLKNLGADLQKLRTALETLKGRGDRIVLGEIGLTPDAKKTIDLSVDEAHRLHHHYIGTEHILLALTRQPNSTAGSMLLQTHISLDDIYAATSQVLNQSPAKTPPAQEQNDPRPEESTTPPLPPRDRFDKFTEHARRVLNYSQEEAQRFQHSYIGTEHLLLGLVREEEGVGAKVLAQLGIELDKVRRAVEFIIGRGDRIVLGEIGLTPRAKKVIELAVDEARRLNHHYIGSEHILLGLIREGEGIASGVLESLGARLENVRTATLLALNMDEGQIEEMLPSTATYSAARDRLIDRQQVLGIWHNISIDGYAFTFEVGKVLMLAEAEVRRVQRNVVRPEHLLLALIEEGKGIAARVLLDLGIDLDKARAAVAQVETVEEKPGRIKPAPLTLAYILLATDEAEQLQQTQIDTQHILLGLTREPQGTIPEVFSSLGIELATVRSKTLAAISG